MASTTNPKSALLDGPGLRRLFEAAAAAVEARVDAINALNVFPVPDGDTGTNMSLTLRAALEDVMRSSSDSAGETAAAMARGALMGARGNSGVITSQLLRGFSRSVQAKARLSGADIAEAFQQASAQAYKVVTQPVEGTILTVIREVAAATRQSVGTKASVSDVLEAAERAASSAVARTPFLLPVLRENGVVDAGAEGLSVMLSGMSRHSRGEPPIVPAAPIVRAAAFAKGAGHADDGYGFCTEVLVERCTASPETLRERLAAMGQSLLVAADDNLTKVHIHTEKPDDLVAYLAGLGKVLQVKADDISKQHREASARRSPATTAEVGIVAVVAGESMARLYRSLGAIEIVPGGQTMNPSVQQLIDAIEQAAAKRVIVLPNNVNV
ncbi:MAG: DAK2 domain-containing protein, partial [Chloroflexi bacterium]|nr:DAK2 domain-containing protein [Chloroflexota bacterium]